MTTFDTKISLKATYRPRSVWSLEVWKHKGWTLKVYGIAEANEYPRSEAVTAAKRAAAQVLPRPPRNDHQYGSGFSESTMLRAVVTRSSTGGQTTTNYTIMRS